MLDRVIQQALAQVLEPLFDPEFSGFSYGFRKRRGAHDAVRQAVLTALSRKSYWHLSRTMATQWGLNDTWLKSQGLVSIRDIWIAFHYPAANQSGLRAVSR